MSSFETPSQSCEKVVDTPSFEVKRSKQLPEHLRSSSTQVLERFFSKIKFSTFKKMYPKIYKKDPEHLRDLYEQFVSQLKTTINEDIDELCEEQKIFSKLQDLPKLCKEVENEKMAWRPTGNPTDDIRDHSCEVKLKYKAGLENILSVFCQKNEELEKQFSENNDELLKIKQKILDIDAKNCAEIDALCANSSCMMTTVNGVFENFK